jgi:hypothetical protein
MSKLLSSIAALISVYILSVSTVQAIPVTIGALSSNDDGSTEVISDSLNNIEWLRWDILGALTYSETVDIISAGGAYEGWNIANDTHALQFVTALSPDGNAACGQDMIETSCYNNPRSDYLKLIGGNYSYQETRAFFLQETTNEEAGQIQVFDGYGSISKFRWGTIFGSDAYSGYFSTWPNVTWMLYRDMETSEVLEPSTLPLLGFGIIGLGFVRRRRV